VQNVLILNQKHFNKIKTEKGLKMLLNALVLGAKSAGNSTRAYQNQALTSAKNCALALFALVKLFFHLKI
jgi:hypothetical protein